MKKWKKKQKKKKLLSLGNFMVVFIVVTMVASTIGYLWSGDEGSAFVYNGHEFGLLQNGNFIVEVDEKRYQFSYTPDAMEYISIPTETITKLKESPTIFFTSDPEDQYKQHIAILFLELETLMKENYDTTLINSFTTDNAFGKQMITCDTLGESETALYIHKGEDTNITVSEGCIDISASRPEELLFLKERLVYGLLGII